jgi:negative regulator of sigma E activity
MKPSCFGQRGDEKFPATLPAARFLIFRTMKDKLQNELREILSRLPDAPVASNFTARVMQQIELEESRQSRKWNFIFNWRAFLPRAAVATVAILFAGLTLQHHELNAQRAARARNVALVAGTPMPDVDALKNFDAIQRMSQPARADEELLALAPEMK